MTNGCSCEVETWRDFGVYMFVTLMVTGIIAGGILGLVHGIWYWQVLFVIGLICVPFYIKGIPRKTQEIK